MKFFRIPVLLGILFFLGTVVNASTIIDTGVPTINSGWVLGGPAAFTNQKLAAQFSFNNAYIINDAFGYINANTGTPYIDLHIYGDSLNSVDTSTVFYSDTFAVDLENPAWYGVTGVNWLLNPGIYWIAFEPRTDFSGYVSVDVPNPLSRYAFASTGDYLELTYNPFGVRINGVLDEGNMVPEPTTMLLFGLGLLGIAGVSRRKK